jgi:hypothetical protein
MEEMILVSSQGLLSSPEDKIIFAVKETKPPANPAIKAAFQSTNCLTFILWIEFIFFPHQRKFLLVLNIATYL